MRLLMLSTDRHTLDPESSVAKRLCTYADELGSIDVILFSVGTHAETEYGAVRVHPTNSFSRWTHGLGALLVARTLERPDVVTVQDPFETGSMGWLISRIKKVPLHVQVHTDFLDPHFITGSFLNRIRRLVARFVLKRASHVRVVSERIADALRSTHYVQRTVPISVLPIFVDVGKFSNIERTRHPRFKVALLWVGRFEEEKQPLLALEALEAARDAGHDTGLTLVGGGSEESRLREYARENGLERYVEFTGWQKDTSRYLASADILLVTSRYEGYGLVTIEALAAGVPVLSTDVGIAQEAGALVTTEEEFSDTLLEWISHGPRSAELQNYPYQDFEGYVRAWCEDVTLASPSD